VEDKNGKYLGTVGNVVLDSWSGELKKFSVRAEPVDTTLFYSPEDVAEASGTAIKLKIAFGETNTTVQYGAKVVDKDGKYLGTVNYLVSDSLTGEVKSFKVKTGSDEQALIFSIDDVDQVTPEKISLKNAQTS